MQSKHYKEIGKRKTRLMMSVYTGLMLIFYLGYILLDNYRLNKSEKWINIDGLTANDVQSIQQLNLWTNIFEISFLGIFIIAAILLYQYRKNKNILIYFTVFQ